MNLKETVMPQLSRLKAHFTPGVCVGLCLLGVGGSGLAWMLTKPSLPSFGLVKSRYRTSEQWVADRDGAPLGRIRADKTGRRLVWLPLEDVSPAFSKSLVAAEDRKFFEHNGVDWRGLAASLVENGKSLVTGGNLRGASTISMQLAEMISPEPRSSSGRRSYFEKYHQIRKSLALESVWSKSQILEAYINLVHFRGELQGLNSASRILFEKNPHGLDTGESAILSALLRSPNAKWKLVQRRACQLDATDCNEIGQKIIELQSRDGRDALAPKDAPHFAYRLALEFPKKEWIESTLDRGLQLEATRLASEQLSFLTGQNVHDVSILVVDNASGAVLAYVGNIPEFSTAQYIDGVQVRRQAGSTLKPFLYGTAFEKNILRPNSLLPDIPFELDTGFGIYRPENYDHRFRGAVSVKDALASSMNIPAVRTLTLVTPDDFVDWLKKLGFEKLNSGDDYGVSLALGTADVSLWELVRAYRVFANHGVMTDLRTTPLESVKSQPSEKSDAGGTPRSLASQSQIPEKTPVADRIFSEATSYRISNILSDREARSATFGLENPLATRFWSAVKTGTSKDMRDNWCVGYSSRFTVGVWIGNFNGDAMWNVSGITGAAPIWIGLMNYLHSQLPSEAPLAPPGVEDDAVPMQAVASEGFSKILAPTDGSVVAWDPDIPSSKQKILFHSSREESVIWRIDGQKLAKSKSATLWLPIPGRHKLELLNSSGEIEDSASFMVRGRVANRLAQKIDSAESKKAPSLAPTTDLNANETPHVQISNHALKPELAPPVGPDLSSRASKRVEFEKSGRSAKSESEIKSDSTQGGGKSL